MTQEIGSDDATQETRALLELLELARRDVAEGRMAPVEALADRIRKRDLRNLPQERPLR